MKKAFIPICFQFFCYRGDMGNAVRLFNKAIELCRTEAEMSHLFSLLHAAKAQLKAAETLGIPLPSNFTPV